MIMNKKFFTLLAGAFLMFAAVFSVNAQTHGYWEKSRLKLADPVKKMREGANPGYYHLKVDSVHSVAGTSLRAKVNPTLPSEMNDTIVLFMGKMNAQGSYKLFVDSLPIANKAGRNVDQFKANGVKAEASAASLWCVTIAPPNQGKNATYNFVNKEQDQLLDLDLYKYESWRLDTATYTASGVRARIGTDMVPGGISGWEFSIPFETKLDSLKPLISYIHPQSDTVAVLCIDTVADLAAGANNRLPKLVVKIASATDVQKGKIEGVLYFTLTEAAPFIVNRDDYNTTFGRKSVSSKLNFNPSNSAGDNPFADNALTAEYITDGTSGIRVRPNDDVTTMNPAWADWTPEGLYNNATFNSTYATFWSTNGQMFKKDTITGLLLDSLGYMRFKRGTQYLKVSTDYFDKNNANSRFLKFEYSPTATGYPTNAALHTFRDSVLFGQTAFRMVYYPSGDSIYINAYQATYDPSFDNDIKTKFKVTSPTDSVTQAAFAFFADTLVLDNPNGGAWSSTLTQADTLNMITARLKYGLNPAKVNFIQPYRYYHLLYVALQNLSGGSRVTLHTNNKTFADGQINTQINFGIYTPCKPGGNTVLTTVEPDLYLIRSESGEYLHVSLYAQSDSATWSVLENDVHPELLPSYQWVVQKQYLNSSTSMVTITNREFEWLTYTVQLDTIGGKPFVFRGSENWNFNNRPINAKTVKFGEHTGANAKRTFISLPKKYKTDKFLGYTWIDPDTAIVSVYSLMYQTKNSPDKYYLGVSKNYPADTLIHGDNQGYFEKMYFSLDTIREEGYGGLNEYGYRVGTTTQVADLVTLERQAYRLNYNDPFKVTCSNPLSVVNAVNDSYALRSRGAYRDILGKPVFYLRHMYHDSKDEEPYFALVQRIDTTTWHPAHASGTDIKDRFEAYLNSQYGTQAATEIMDQMRRGYFNEMLFVAAVERETSILKAKLRIGAQTVSVFKRERDDDPIYRRFNTTYEGAYATDDIDTVHFYSQKAPNQYLFENTGAIATQKNYWEYKVNGVDGTWGRKNYLGSIARATYPNAKTAIIVDTAYINRGTGYIKPQYMLLVDPKPIKDGMGCDEDGNETIPLPGYMRGRYLINAHDSINASGSTDYSYLWSASWTRLVFTDAIHANDHLYILGEYGSDEKLNELGLITRRVERNPETGKLTMFNAVDIEKLHTYATSAAGSKHIKATYLGTNKHKDCVFQFRLVERGSNDFLIESETTDRDTINSPMIAPCEGGWVKTDNNHIPTISKADTYDQMNQSHAFNVYPATKEGYNPNPTDNDEVATVKVIGNASSVSILNAAGKKVVINNILGQTVASTTLLSDNETISAPKGVVVVAIEGEETVKTLVK